MLDVYIVEDSPVILENLVATLHELAPVHVLDSAPDEEGAVAWLKNPNNQCHVVIVDIFLKAGNGLGVLKALKEMDFKGRAVVLTNYATADMTERCKSLGAHRVFDKSNEVDSLIDYCCRLGAHGGTTEPSPLM